MGNHHVDVINNILKDFGLLRSIHNIMNPNKNGFKLENLDYICKNLEGYESEIWFEGKAIGISIEYLETILNKKLLYMNIQDILNFAKK
jgi:DNA-binding Xre family transcriptional regulator